MLIKKQVISAIRKMPEKIESVDLHDTIVLLSKMEQGKQQLKAGNGMSTDQAKKKLKRWLDWIITSYAYL